MKSGAASLLWVVPLVLLLVAIVALIVGQALLATLAGAAALGAGLWVLLPSDQNAKI